MSGSYRKPYMAITGLSRSHDDKKKAARGLRRRQDAWLRGLNQYDQALVPHRLACAFNNTYLWGRDGKQFLTFPYSRIDGCNDLAWNRGLNLQRK